MKKNSKSLSKDGRTDAPLYIYVILLAIFGSIMVFSSGYAYAYARYGDEFYFVKKQSLWIIIGLAVMYLASKIPTKLYKKITPHIYALTLALLIVVLLVGFVGNGAKRWISIGPLTIQPSEIAKLALILMLAKYYSSKEEKAFAKDKKSIFVDATMLPLLIITVPIMLVMLQKHLSCIIILAFIGISMIIISGVDLRYISFFSAIGCIGITCLAIFTDYTKERITVWQDPEAYKLTGGWQTLQGLMAIGSGGLLGVGLGNSVMKHCYVSEPANDMIFAIVCEELGFIGALFTLLLFFLLIRRGIIVSARAEDTYARLVGLGISVKMAIQVLLNIAVVTNSIPNTGISLPFFSYGGSSLIMLFFEMGILASVTKGSKILK